jgi:hypothetical protein|tara:strand:- start:2255 stop:2518 length:264 start_codon:yes stop_codon:yes gene_type:complete
MKSAGVVLDNYKRETFRTVLRAEGRKWIEEPGPMPDTALFKVELGDTAADLDELHRVVKKCEVASRKVRKPLSMEPRIKKGKRYRDN